MLTAILLSAVWVINIQSSSAANTLNVPGDFPTITQAINQASDGDTISIKSGTYVENLEINKAISLIGENPTTTIIMGEGGLDRGARPVVALNFDNSKISGFTIKSLPYLASAYSATGIIIHGDHCAIQNNIIQSNYIGIFCSVQSYTQIINNTIVGNFKDGMRFYGGSFNNISSNSFVGNAVSGVALQGYSNTVTDNTFKDNYRALGLGSSYSVVFGNKFVYNIESGIWLAGSKNIIAANDLSNNNWGIYITSQMGAPHDNTFYHNNFVDNAYSIYVNESSPVEFWDNGSQVGGNFWSDYSSKYPYAIEIGESGIANAPYAVYAGAQDNYPLTTKFDTSNLAEPPVPNLTPTEASNGLAAWWSFNNIDSNGISLDSTGNNPAILGSMTSSKSYMPKTIDGEFGKALAFDGQEYINVPASPSLEISKEATVDVWINVQSYKEIPYNNIIVECVRTTDALPTRSFGLAINGEAPQNDSAPPIGALRGYVLTNEGLNEIVTSKAVVSLNQWIHVVFTRSIATGMHIYVDGKEQPTVVSSGVANPSGLIVRQTETYIGHDAICTIDELKISNTADSLYQPMWMQWWLWAIFFVALVASGVMLYYSRHRQLSSKK